MSETNSISLAKTRPRLKFIDMARSIAILLMLEGHFIDEVLDPVYRNLDYPVYATWLYIRGFTGAMFLTVTGIVFVYLLLNNRIEPYFRNVRVKKGFKRVLELLFWGYLLQYYAFHVLECIGFGILSILLIFGIYKLIKFLPLWIYFLFAGTSILLFYLYFAGKPDEYLWPKGVPSYFQYMFHGPRDKSVFPILPWMSFTMYGAMFGSLLHDFKDYIKKWRFAILLLVVGALLFWFGKPILVSLDNLMSGGTYKLFRIDWLYQRLGMVLMILSFLMIIEKLLGEIKQNLFLKIGQNTLTIYIIHMMILYGSVIRIGVIDFYHRDLGPWESAFGAALFLTFFILIVHYLDKIKSMLSFILVPIQKFWAFIYRLKN